MLIKIAELLHDAGLRHSKDEESISLFWRTKYRKKLPILIIPNTTGDIGTIMINLDLKLSVEQTGQELGITLLKKNFTVPFVKFGVNSRDEVVLRLDFFIDNLDEMKLKNLLFTLLNQVDKFDDLSQTLRP